MPQRGPGRGIQSHHIIARPRTKHQIPRRRQQPRPRAALPLMRPLRFPRLIVNRRQERLLPSPAIIPAPTFRFVFRVVEVIHAVSIRRIHIEQPRFRIKRRRLPVRRATLIRTHQSPVQLRFLRRIRNRLTLRIHALRPVRRSKRSGCNILPRNPVQQEKIPVPTRLCQQFPRLPVNHTINQNRSLIRIPVMRVMRRRLEVPRHPPRIRTHCNNRLRVKIVPRTRLARNHRLRIARAEIKQIQYRIIGRRTPRHPAAMQHRFHAGPRLRFRIPRLRMRIPAPLHLTRLGIMRRQITGYVRIVTAHAHNHMIANNQRGRRPKIHLLQITNRFVPPLLAVLDIQGHQMAIRRLEIQPVAGHGHATIPNMNPALRRPREVPDLPPRPRIHRPGMIRSREIQHPIDLQRC